MMNQIIKVIIVLPHSAPFSPTPSRKDFDLDWTAIFAPSLTRFSESMLTLISRSRIEFEFSRHWGLSLSSFYYDITATSDTTVVYP